MDKNICSVCNTENEPKYKFCKNCGSTLNLQEENSYSLNAEFKERVVNETVSENNGFNEFDFNGISNEEMGAFIGKKAIKILPKFTKMQLSNSKASWCWPAAILGFIFGPMGSALWFFFRKMYKIAFIFAIIGAIIMISASVMTVGVDSVYNDMSEEIGEFIFKFDLGGILRAAQEAESRLTITQRVMQGMADAINSISGLASGIISGLFGFWFYKEFCAKKILDYKASGVDSRFYKIGLAAVGGTSGGMLVVGIVLMFMASELATYISQIIMAVI